MKKFIIIDPEDGVFLGTTNRNDLPPYVDIPQDARIVALFSANNIFDLTKAVAFFHEDDAKKYLNTYIARRCPDAFVASIETNKNETPYVDAVDILKAGYGSYIEDMVDALPMLSQELH